MRADHREAVAEQHDDRRLHAGQRLRQHDDSPAHRRGSCGPPRCTNARATDLRHAGSSGSTSASRFDTAAGIATDRRAAHNVGSDHAEFASPRDGRARDRLLSTISGLMTARHSHTSVGFATEFE